jgi:hypothetical protein
LTNLIGTVKIGVLKLWQLRHEEKSCRCQL